MESHRDVIALWPSASELDRKLKLHPGTAKAWRQRNSIPVHAFERLIALAKRDGIEGVTYGLLSRTKPKRAAAARARQET